MTQPRATCRWVLNVGSSVLGSSRSSSNGIVSLSGDELESVRENGGTMVVEFRADGCPACDETESTVESLARKHGDDVPFGRIDMGDNRETVMDYEVSAIPTFLFIKDGEIVGREVGALPEDELENRVRNLET